MNNEKNNPKPIIVTNLCILRKADMFLLAMKKRGFGSGKYNGYGGKLADGETIEEAMVREVKEESGLNLLKYEKRGEAVFELVDLFMEVHIYEGVDWDGDLIETEEMAPEWFTIDSIPYENMWPSDIKWYTHFINRDFFNGTVVF